MSKKVWVRLTEWNKSIVTTALESGVSLIITDKDEWQEKIRDLGIIKVCGNETGDVQLDKDITFINIKTKKDEERVVAASKTKKVVVTADNWKIIPLENIIANTDNVLLEVQSLAEAELALTTMEKGVSGVVLTDPDLNLIKQITKLTNTINPKIEFEHGIVEEIIPVGVGDRVCIDTCTKMSRGQGMLIGSSSQCMCLVHAETIENPYVATRPFRVNAGGIHSYVKMPSNKTSYLSDLNSGDQVMIVNANGATENAIVGRVKIERRPLLLLKLSVNEKIYTAILQNAETVCIVDSAKKPVSVVKLKKGDKILAAVEKTGRHFGIKIQETITEQ